MIVTLREVIPSDLPLFFRHQQDPEACAMVVSEPRGEAAFLAHWEKTAADPQVRRRTILVDGQVAGYVGSFERLGLREVCYWLGREHWGKGAATVALGLFLSEEAARPLHARVAKSHFASRRVLEKCGFRVTGEDMSSGPGGAPVPELILELKTPSA